MLLTLIKHAKIRNKPDIIGNLKKKPIDKKSNYVKRCVGIPGDTLEIFNGELRINGDKSILPYRAKPLFKYIYTCKNFKIPYLIIYYGCT